LSDDEAFAEYVARRFADNGGKPYCPHCGHKEVYSISTRRIWKCAAKHCRRQFSATSGTIFASRKLSYRDLLLVFAHFVNAVKGLSAIRLSQELEVSYPTAFVLKHKIREAIGTEQHSRKLRGEIETDGAYFGGHVRPRNKAPSRVDRRKLNHRSDKRQCVTIMRERGGRSRAFIVSEAEAARMIPDIVEPGSIIYSDEGKHWNRLGARYDHRTVNHSERYSDGDKSTNWAESYFARLRRAEMGTHHHIAGPYLAGYANEASWREDRRRYSNAENYGEALRITTHHPISRQWKGYWQRERAAA
jgi:transposase-like protein